MSTIRIAKNENFTVLPNETLNDERLSYRARGVLAWLLSKPNDWMISSEKIATAGKEGRDAIRTALTELEVGGYLVRDTARRDGKFHCDHVLYESPQRETSAGSSAPDSQASYKELSPSTEQRKDAASPPSEPEISYERALAGVVVLEWWESLSKKPSTGMIAFVKLAERLLVNGWTETDLREGIKATKFKTADLKAWKTQRDNPSDTATGPAIPPDIAKAWFEVSAWLIDKRPELAEHKREIMGALKTLQAWGFGLGESLIRIACSLRYVRRTEQLWDPKFLADDRNHMVARFNGMPDGENFYRPDATLVECMQYAYDRQRWQK